MIEQSQSLELRFTGEVCNVMYFEHDESLYINDINEESVQIHGISPSKMVNLMRNLVCCGDSKIKLDQLKDHEVNTLRECMQKLHDMFTEYADAGTMRGEM